MTTWIEAMIALLIMVIVLIQQETNETTNPLWIEGFLVAGSGVLAIHVVDFLFQCVTWAVK